MTSFRLLLILVLLAPACSGPPSDGGATTVTLDVPDLGAPPAAAPSFPRVGRYTRLAADSDLITDVYFPWNADDAESYPLAVLLQGGNISKDDYTDFAARVAAYGVLVAVPEHEGLLGRFANLESVETTRAFVRAESLDPESPLFGLLDDSALAILGHSFGGAATLDAVRNVCRFPFCSGSFERPDDLLAVSVYGSNLCESGNCDAEVASDGIPVQMIQGDLDGLAEPQEAQATFERIESGPKQLLSLSGANHFGITNTNNAGSNEDPNTPTLDQTSAVESVGRWTGQFLRAYLLEDPAALDYVTASGAESDPDVTQQFVP